MNVLAFDIRTVPDVRSGQKVYDLAGLSDADTAKAMAQLRTAKSGCNGPAYHLQRIVSISLVHRHLDTVNLVSLGDGQADERDILQQFLSGVEHDTPTLVSWNALGVDLPILHYRTLLQGIEVPRYWEAREDNTGFQLNAALSSAKQRHIDLMGEMVGSQVEAAAPLGEIATMLGYPGKTRLSDEVVWERYQSDDFGAIANDCDIDALNTYLAYLRFELMRGRLTQMSFAAEEELLIAMLADSGKSHLIDFLKAWKNG